MRIIVGLSGGVDSAYAAYSLISAGHSVEGAVSIMHDYTDTAGAERVAATLGALAAGVPDGDDRMKNAAHYAETIGMVFQIVDDILDVTGTAQELGKQPGSDVAQEKTTFLSFLTIPEARRYAEQLNESATAALQCYENNEFLLWLAQYLLERSH